MSVCQNSQSTKLTLKQNRRGICVSCRQNRKNLQLAHSETEPALEETCWYKRPVTGQTGDGTRVSSTPTRQIHQYNNTLPPSLTQNNPLHPTRRTTQTRLFLFSYSRLPQKCQKSYCVIERVVTIQFWLQVFVVSSRISPRQYS